MKPRSTRAMVVQKYKRMYQDMTEDKLNEEIEAIIDQLMAYMLATKTASVETMIDRDHTILCIYKNISCPRSRMN